ncbi:twin-arginine translocation signal domain-containing protein [Granulosicoccus sp. 3-233]|uniref:twin-arginine translocation signal domain-containing protein n=1 Tax=Granulosicoccus sp. 3-233 TaxID=3417969 RepID=UPI003D331114
MTDEKKPGFINARRRGFLQGAAVASGAVASGAASAASNIGDVVEASDVVDTASGKKGYERTEHVNRYYSRARF